MLMLMYYSRLISAISYFGNNISNHSDTKAHRASEGNRCR